MAVVSVPRELRDKLGDAATDSLVDLLHQFGSDQREDLITVVEERFARHVADTRDTLRSETHAGLDGLRSELHTGLDGLRSELHTGLDGLRSELHTGLLDVQKQFLVQQQQIADVRADLGKEIAEVRKEITVQTRWLLTVLVAASVLIPVMQRVLTALFP